MSFTHDALTIAAPAVTAGIGAYWASHSQRTKHALDSSAQFDTELRTLVDDAVATFERANQWRHMCYLFFVREGLHTTDPSREAINTFGAELSKIAELRNKLHVRTESGSPLYSNFVQAFDSLVEASRSYSLAADLPPGDMHALKTIQTTVFAAEDAYKAAIASFVSAAQVRLAPPTLVPMHKRIWSYLRP